MAKHSFDSNQLMNERKETPLIKPKAVHARDIINDMPYIGEYFQPDDRVYHKDKMDKYIEWLESTIKSLESTIKSYEQSKERN